uniref:Alpha-1,3-mannosyl-glycoprotein 2-beta-N-acetylglucosaminyltransferase n=1 Tax=Lygus hesperus TaxID=30085 RepID=A0A0A9WLM6_LYGHE
MIILKYLTKFRLILYVGIILCIIVVTTNPYTYLWSGDFTGGTLVEENSSNPEFLFSERNEEIRVSEIYPNCGIRYICPEETFPVHIYTGQDKDDQPKLCIQGKYLAGGGRGLNFAVIEPKRLQLVYLQNYDLYSHNSTALETMLTYGINIDDIVIAFTFDEASKELSKRAKQLLYQLGSGKIQDLQYRSQWYMISQKTENSGFTPLETLTYARNDRWGELIDERLCVPRKINHLMISPDPVPRKNPVRERLCSVNKELACHDFCGALARHEPIVPSLLTNRSLIGNVVFSTPILVIAGKSMSSLALTLETLVYQPGIHSAAVFILYTEDQVDVPTLGRVFGFRSVLFNASYNSGANYKMNFGLKFIHDMLPKKKYVIVIEEGLILAPDYLFYLAQMAPVIEKDDTILAVSAWNPYGYKNVSGRWSVVYRVEDFPGMGSLIRMDVFLKSLYNKMDVVCPNKTFMGCPAVLKEYKDGNIIIPDVSRVLLRPREYLKRPKDEEYRMFTTPRKTNTNINAYIDRPHDMTEDRYFRLIAGLIESSITIRLTKEDLVLCQDNANIAMKVMLAELRNKVFAVYYQEESCTDHQRLRSYALCFDIYIPPSSHPQTIYKKVFRFTIGTNSVLLIETSSPFAKNKMKI